MNQIAHEIEKIITLCVGYGGMSQRTKGNSPAVGKMVSMFQGEPLEDYIGDMLTKRDFGILTKACQEIEQGLIALSIPLPPRNAIMELIIARLALACATDNTRFDSFQFREAARKKP